MKFEALEFLTKEINNMLREKNYSKEGKVQQGSGRVLKDNVWNQKHESVSEVTSEEIMGAILQAKENGLDFPVYRAGVKCTASKDPTEIAFIDKGIVSVVINGGNILTNKDIQLKKNFLFVA